MDDIIGFVLVGFVLGGIGRDVGLFIRTKSLWTLQKEIIDWDKVDKLLDNKSINGIEH
jgi:hypothetical protein